MNPHVNLSKLLALRSIRHDPIISALENAILLGENGMQERNECCSRLITAAENLGLKGNLLSRYLLHVIIYRSNIVSEIMEQSSPHFLSGYCASTPASYHTDQQFSRRKNFRRLRTYKKNI